jgi:HlyD family secretion protein
VHALSLYGNIDIRETDLGFDDAGRVANMRVDEGDTVHRGELLATLDAARYQAAVDAAQAEVAARASALARLLAGSRPEEIARARAEVQAIAANLANAQSHMARSDKLARHDYVSQQQLDDDRDRVRLLKAQLDAAQQTLILAVKGPRKEDIAEARANLEAAQATLALDLRELRDTRLYAMENGVVKVRVVEPGTIVEPQSPIYTIALTDPVWVRAYVDERDLGRIRPGMTAEVYSDSEPKSPYKGWIGFISPVAEFTPKSVETPETRTSLVYRIRVYVHNRGDTLRQGMPVTVRIPLAAPAKVAARESGK